jgi:hypothetical protein
LTFNPRRNPWYSFSDAESTSGHMVLLGEPWKKFPVATLGIDPGTVRLVAQCLKHYSTPGPNFLFLLSQNNIKFHEVRPVGNEFLYADGRTDRQDEANSRFSQFCRRSKMRYYLLYTFCTLDNYHKTVYTIYDNMNSNDM